jgi:heat shock 70kDa protein 1/2/6/8
MPRGVPQIDVTFEVDWNGILSVSAVEKSSGKANKITIVNENTSMSAEDIERSMEAIERYQPRDEEEKMTDRRRK